MYTLTNIYVITPNYIYYNLVVPGVGAWWCLMSSVVSVVVPGVGGGIYAAGHPGRAHTRLLSVAALSLLNQGFEVEFTDAIALIINYLGVPFRICFTKQERVKK